MIVRYLTARRTFEILPTIPNLIVEISKSVFSFKNKGGVVFYTVKLNEFTYKELELLRQFLRANNIKLIFEE